MPARGAVKRLQRLASSSICSKVLDTFHELEEEGVAAWADQLQALLARHLQPNLYQVILLSIIAIYVFIFYIFNSICTRFIFYVLFFLSKELVEQMLLRLDLAVSASPKLRPAVRQLVPALLGPQVRIF